ncbi:uncharacterized protein (DUF58 family) [Fontibacillus phaseoli]|uniref:Uncharacterized protein (DUF58 family) n=1 Tax=Fontibacillus phaseoli TaxID=1416533 RepID=A0A369B6U2_9BACL|nr:DUF58 domain-containing protein [Fontibacillus phaseoli]RCX16247.1 uncharacterized protein (DUF58 family) [Fontibacillus phaseoli]
MKNGLWTWLVCVLAVGSLGALYGWKGGKSLLFLLLLLVIVIVQGAVAQLFGPKHAKVERSWYPLNPRAGESVVVTLTIKLSGGFPLWVQAEDAWSVSQETGPDKDGERQGSKLVFGGWKREFTGTYYMEKTSRGIYTGEPVLITWGDSFGWFKRSLRAAANDVLVIHPAPLPVDPAGQEILQPDGEGVRSGRAATNQGSLDTGLLRTYEPGDPLRRIHWKSSAKKGALLTRIPDLPESPSRFLILDTDEASYPRDGNRAGSAANQRGPGSGFELAVSAAAVWFGRELESSREVGFSYGGMGRSREPGSRAAKIFSGSRGLKAALDLLAGATTAPGLSGAELLRFVQASEQVHALTFITGRLTQELTEASMHFAGHGKTLEIWCACGNGEHADSASLAMTLRECGLSVVDLRNYSSLPAMTHKGGDRHDIA